MDTPQPPWRRSDDEVRGAARAMDRALNAGLPGDLLLIMLAAREAWWGVGEWPADSELIRVLMDPRARVVDEVVFAAVKRRVRG